MGVTSIEWTSTVQADGTVTPGRSWNPVRGCSRVSEGCRNCYAERIAARFSTHAQQDGDKPGGVFAGFAETKNGQPHWTGRVELVPSKLDEPLRWKKPARVFVNSMSDLFHEKLDFREIAAVFGIMAAASRHTFQVLTKRPQRMLEFFDAAEREAKGWDPPNPVDWCVHNAWKNGAGHRKDLPDAPAAIAWPLPNVWLGVSVEDQATADERIPLLLQTPAAVRFVSYEPALAPIDLRTYLTPGQPWGERFLDWVIVGGESGPHARPFDVAWARSVIGQCRMYGGGVPVFVKQLGAHPCEAFSGSGQIFHHGHPVDLLCKKLRDRKGGDPAEWPADLRIRQFPEAR